MNYKITGGLKKNKKTIIIGLVLWVILIIVLVLPFTVAKNIASDFVSKNPNQDFLTNFFAIYQKAITNPLDSIKYIFTNGAVGQFFSNWFVITILYLIFFVVGFVKTMPKHEYDNIEHGSSDWSEHGEQYKIISNKKVENI